MVSRMNAVFFRKKMVEASRSFALVSLARLSDSFSTEVSIDNVDDEQVLE